MVECRKLIISEIMFKLHGEKPPCRYGNNPCKCTYHIICKVLSPTEIIKEAFIPYVSSLKSNAMTADNKFKLSEARRIRDNLDKFIIQ